MDRRLPSFASVAALALLVLAVVSRVVPHPWNFTPMIAIALFGGARLPNRWLAAIAVLACLAAGDMAVGVFPYEGMWWVYGAIVAVVAIGRIVTTRTSAVAIVLAALGGGFAFFAISNFGVWLGTMYPHTPSGLVDCYVAALPFYRNQIIGDLVFTGALFGLHAIAIDLRARATA
jgi:hypothetical protein